MAVSHITLDSAYGEKQAAREALAAEGYVVDVASSRDWLAQIPRIPFAGIFEGITRRDLTFEEAFVGTCYALRATNAFFAEATRMYFADVQCPDFTIAGREFLSCMAVKEAWRGITPDEIAGMVQATGLDLVVRLPPPGDVRIFETCGTGGDIGLPPRERPRKTINASTLSSLVMASLGIPTMKHGSYANTSAVGSTDAIERFGARVEQRSRREMEELWRRTGFCFTDAHVVKSIHDLSHLRPRHETVNHVIGPMTPPVAADKALDKVMGVNEKVHPETVAQAFVLLSRSGAQLMGNAAVVCGLDTDVDPHRLHDREAIREHVMLDELSPHSSVVSFVQHGVFVGTHLLHPSDFGLDFEHDGIALENRAEVLQRANEEALRGRNPRLADYLAMNAALCLYVSKYLGSDPVDERRGPNCEMLRECFERCRAAIIEGRPWGVLCEYVHATGGTVRSTL